MTNPFTFGNPIREPERFFGRQAEIRQIVNRLMSSAHESTSIVGERRIGKTSLLNHLSNPETAARYGLAPEQFCLVYIDFQGLTDITPARFWQRVLGKAARSLCDEKLAAQFKEYSAREKYDLFDLEDLFEGVVRSKRTVVLLMDEFEYVTQNPGFGSDFFGGLRSLAIHSNLALVPATRRELVDLCHSEELKGSPFFNIFANVVLRPFPREDAVALIEGYLSGLGVSFAQEEKEFVLRLGGGHPFFVQIVGHYLVEAHAQGLKGDALLENVVTAFDEQADPHFDYLWAHSTESEKITLLSVMALSQQKPSRKTPATIENLKPLNSRAHLDAAVLVKRGLLLENEGIYRIFSPGLERWIALEISAPPGEAESQASAEEWLRSPGGAKSGADKGALLQFKKKYWPVVSGVLKTLVLETYKASVSAVVKTWIS